MPPAIATMQSKSTAFEYLLSNDGPYECLLAVLRHLNHEDVQNLLLVPSKAIQQNVVLNKVAADWQYNGLLQGSCQYPIFDKHKQVGVCGNSPLNNHDVRMCKTHNDRKFSVCHVHVGPSPGESKPPDFYCATCSQCIVRISEQISDQGYDFCQCGEDIKTAQTLWSCKLCWRYLTLRRNKIGSGERCDVCFPTLDDFKSHFIISTAPRLNHCLSTLDQVRDVRQGLPCLMGHSPRTPGNPGGYLWQCCNNHRGYPFLFEGAWYNHNPASSAPLSEIEKKAKQLGGAFYWCKGCRKLRADPWTGSLPKST